MKTSIDIFGPLNKLEIQVVVLQAKAEQKNDAVNLQLIQDLIKKETDTIYDVIASLRNEMVHDNMMIDAL